MGLDLLTNYYLSFFNLKKKFMVNLLNDFKNLSREQRNVFWEFVFGFVSYDIAYDKLYDEQRVNENIKTEEFVYDLINFINLLHQYRTMENAKGFKQIDNEQLFILSKNDFKNMLPPVCVLLDKKTLGQQKRVSSPLYSWYSTDKEKKDIEELESLQKKQDGEQLYLLGYALSRDRVFFSYVQTLYSLICQSLFNFLKCYIRSRAEYMTDKEKLDFPELEDEQTIKSLWQDENKILSAMDLQNHDFFHIFDKMLNRFKNQANQLDNQLIIDMEGLPLPSFFWNLSDPWEYPLILWDFKPDDWFFSLHVCVYYLSDHEYDPWRSDAEVDGWESDTESEDD